MKMCCRERIDAGESPVVLSLKFPGLTDVPTPLPCFLEVLILKDFKSFEPEVLK